MRVLPVEKSKMNHQINEKTGKETNSSLPDRTKFVVIIKRGAA